MNEAEPTSIERALAVALDAHRGAVDKAGKPYILHVIRVMSRMTTDDERLVAILHDVVEDSHHTIEELRAMGFPPPVIAAVEKLTKPDGADYSAYISQLRDDPLACAVKLADLEDNMDIRRLDDPTEKDLARLRKYRAAWASLQSS